MIGGFEPKQFDNGLICRRPVNATQTIVRGDLLKWSNGRLSVAAAGDDEVKYLAMQNSASAAVGTMIEVLRITDAVYFHALVNITPVRTTHVGNDYDVKTKASIDLENTTDKIFHVEEIINATGKIVGGHFNKPALA